MSMKTPKNKGRKAPKVPIFDKNKNVMKESGTGNKIGDKTKIYRRKNLSP